MDVILLFASKTSTFDSQTFQYLEIFGFIPIDFMCFSNVVFLEIYSVFCKQESVFLFLGLSTVSFLRKKKRKQTWFFLCHSCDVTRSSMRVFVTAVRSPLSYILLGLGDSYFSTKINLKWKKWYSNTIWQHWTAAVAKSLTSWLNNFIISLPGISNIYF